MIRTRFAPSPTGYLHVGSLRTALYCYLFARKEKGTFVLRVEDTDQTRYVEGAVENLLKTLDWAGITPDEGPQKDGSEKGEYGPYTQSERTELYQEHAQKLLDNDQAYYCFCDKERLDQMREKQKKAGKPTMYDGHCRNLPAAEVKKQLDAGTTYVIRQKVPYKNIRFKDLIRGNVQFDGKLIDDQILIKSDGYPTYHLANVVDDHYMKITHVIRGEEWLPSTPKHLALYESFGWEAPRFAHIPLLLNPDRTKLSKRQGHVAVEEYIKEGYLPEAVINFVAFLGWHPGGDIQEEIFTLKELCDLFDLEKVHKSGAIFDLEKLDWYNWHWRKEKFNAAMKELALSIDPQAQVSLNKRKQQVYQFSSPVLEEEFLTKKEEKLLSYCQKYLPQKYLAKESHNLLLKSLDSVEEKLLKDPKRIAEEIDFYFQLPNYSKELLTHEKMGVELGQAAKALSKAQSDLQNLENWTTQEIRATLVQSIQDLGIKNGQMLWPLRAALSGKEYSPGAFEIAWALGKAESLKRIEQAISKAS